MKVKKSNIRTELIYVHLKASGITKAEFCKKCGIRVSLLNKILDGYEDVSTITIHKIADCLNLRYHQMFDDLK